MSIQKLHAIIMHKRTPSYHPTTKPMSFFLTSGMHYRKSCASSGACLIASSGYQQFCTGKLNSVCITCCNTPLCNGPRQKKRPQSSSAITINALQLPACSVFVLLLLVSILCWHTFVQSQNACWKTDSRDILNWNSTRTDLLWNI